MALLHELTDRDMIRKIICDYAKLKGKEHRAIYRILYSALEDQFLRSYKGEMHLDIKKGSTERGITGLAYIEMLELIPMALNIAKSVFREALYEKQTSVFEEDDSRPEDSWLTTI